jgi:hypothetical protein
MSTTKDVIDQVRREEFLIGVDLPPDAQVGWQKMRAKLHHALRLLSDELYSRETQFVLELVQNVTMSRVELFTALIRLTQHASS